MSWSYSLLKTKVGDWLKRTDLSSSIDDAILMFESEYDSKPSIWRKNSTANLTTYPGTATVDLPDDFERMVSLERVGYPGRISVVTIDGMKDYRVGISEPRKVSIYPDNKLIFGPTPDGTYTYELIYVKRLDGLSESNASNWLLEKYPHAYLYGVLFYMLEYVQDADRATLIAQKHNEIMLSLTSNASVMDSLGYTSMAISTAP